MELIIYNQKPAEAIKFNFEELKKELTEGLEKYRGLVYDEKSISEAKKDRATLNNFKKAIEDKRKEVKKQCLEPYENFEKQIKELVALVDEPVLEIDKQVKYYEQKKKDEKEAKIKVYYTENIGELASLLPLERIFDGRWLNATCRDKEWQTAIDAAIQRTTSDLQTIADLKSEFELQIKDTYLRTLDLSSALNEKTRLEQQKARLAEYEAKKAEEAKEADEAPIIQRKPESQVVYEPIYEVEQTKTIKVIFYDTTAAFRSDMKDLTDRHNIRYGGIK